MDYDKQKKELAAQFEANIKQINTLQALNFQLQGKYQLLEQLEKEQNDKSIEPERSEPVSS